MQKVILTSILVIFTIALSFSQYYAFPKMNSPVDSIVKFQQLEIWLTQVIEEAKSDSGSRALSGKAGNIADFSVVDKSSVQGDQMLEQTFGELSDLDALQYVNDLKINSYKSIENAESLLSKIKTKIQQMSASVASSNPVVELADDELNSGYSTWHLTGILKGVTYEQSRHPKEYKILQLDSKGGKIEVIKWDNATNNCYQTVLYSWTFSKDVSTIHQDEEIKINLNTSVIKDNTCGALRYFNRWLQFFGANGGMSGGSKLLKGMSHESRYLTWGESKRIHSKRELNGEAVLQVVDKTGIGVEMNAPDGFFKFSLNGEYDVVYVYKGNSETPEDIVTTSSGSPGWRLEQILEGSTYNYPTIEKNYVIEKLDGEGGIIHAKRMVKGRTDCYQTVEYTWQFGSDVSGLCQDEIIPVQIEAKVIDQNVCGDVRYWNRWIKYTSANGGAAGGSKLLTNLSHESRYLTWGESKRIHANTAESGNGEINVADKTGIGVDMDAKDGFFKFVLNGEYEVVYHYLEDQTACTRY